LSDVFDIFMQQNNLYEIALSDTTDERIAMAFQQADLPFRIPGILRTFISKIHSPLAIRSSSLLEDAIFEPFAGIYGTKMTPNNQPDIDTRFRKLIEAIKFVYASTYFRAAKDYIKTTRHKTEDEKMAIIIQEVIGVRHNGRFYPEISGIARSYNYYPIGNAKPEEGVVNLALGLGKTIVDGGFSWSYSPSFPQSGPPFNSTGDMLKFTQTEFWAINMGDPPEYDPICEIEYMVKNDLSCAESDNTLKDIASTYDVSSDRIWMGLNGNDPRILNFAPILTGESYPLNKLLKTILKVCEAAFKLPVEIEFALTLSNRIMKFGFLQVRPIAVSMDETCIKAEEKTGDGVFISSGRVLGNGVLNSIRDIVYVDFVNFNLKASVQIAGEIEMLNRKLVDENRSYLLIGYGRWGTSDPSAGIPVQWHQISGAKVIVEAPVERAYIEMSQGSHFFHNIIGSKIIYFSIQPYPTDKFDRDWLSEQKIIEKRQFVKHIRIKNDLLVKANGRTSQGVILKFFKK
ncbi:MAG: phosphoenolpyruvate synthase, partial [Bacteroidales bacterium]|nr:phosphoenolpyruvate synthase [Bacteroidales bacterium]